MLLKKKRIVRKQINLSLSTPRCTHGYVLSHKVVSLSVALRSGMYCHSLRGSTETRFNFFREWYARYNSEREISYTNRQIYKSPTVLCLTFFQHEAKMKTLHAGIKEMEAKKRVLEEAVDSLNEEVTKIRAEGKSLWICFENCAKYMAKYQNTRQNSRGNVHVKRIQGLTIFHITWYTISNVVPL